MKHHGTKTNDQKNKNIGNKTGVNCNTNVSFTVYFYYLSILIDRVTDGIGTNLHSFINQSIPKIIDVTTLEYSQEAIFF